MDSCDVVWQCTKPTPGVAGLLFGLLLALMLMACGPALNGSPDGDAGADANDVGLETVLPTPPDIPWLAEGVPPVALPMFTPCPTGWHEVVDEDPEGGMDVVTCDPYGDTLGGTEPDTCPDGWAHFVGDPACTPVGAPCPAGDFPERLPTDAAVLYVLSSALVGGDGSRGSPLGTITEALNMASAGTVVAIGKGEYDEALRLPAGVTLWGACAAETRLTASSPGLLAQGVITVPSADTQVTNLRIGPADLPGVVVYGSRASMAVDGVIIEDVRKLGLQALRGARVFGRELIVSGTRGGGGLGRGVEVNGGSTVQLTRAVFAQNRNVGVLVHAVGTTLTLSDAVVRDTMGQESGGTMGWGLVVQEGASAEVSRTVVAWNRDAGVFVAGEGTSLALSDAVVRDTRARASDGTGGRGLTADLGATVEARRSSFSRNRGVGVFANRDGSRISLSDVVVRDTNALESDGTTGNGLVAHQGGTVEVTRAVLSRNREAGIHGDGAATSLTLSDVVVRDTLAAVSGETAGRGLNLQLGATAEISRAVLSHNRQIGAFASGEGTSLTLRDVVVHDTQPQVSDGMGGRGLNVQQGATVVVSRMVLSRNREIAVYVSGEGAALTMSDVVARDTQADESDRTGGRGLNVQAGAFAEVTRGVVARHRDIGVYVGDVGTVARLMDVVIGPTEERACAAASCRDRPFGVGLATADEGTLEATRFDVWDAALCGVMIATGAQIDLSLGEVSGSSIGLCLQVDDYSLSRLTDNVHFVDNAVNLDTTSLPVPGPANPISDAR